MAVLISQELKEVLEASKLCFFATVDEDGSPNLSPKASLKVWDNQHLIFANIASPRSVSNLANRPDVCINVVDFFKRKGFKINGMASVYKQGTEEYEEVSNSFWETNGKSYPIPSVVKIRVTEISPVISPAYTYGEDLDEEVITKTFHKVYTNHE